MHTMPHAEKNSPAASPITAALRPSRTALAHAAQQAGRRHVLVSIAGTDWRVYADGSHCQDY